MSRTIAIVEDDADQRDNYAHALQAQGYAIQQYANRKTALDGFNNNLPDLAILDTCAANCAGAARTCRSSS